MELLYRELTGSILDCAYKVHTSLGPGLLESAYEECLAYELENAGHKVSRQQPMPLVYCDKKLNFGYRVDLMIDDAIILEIKSVDLLNPVHLAQLMTYLKLSGCKIGFLMNFNVVYLKDGIRRVIL